MSEIINNKFIRTESFSNINKNILGINLESPVSHMNMSNITYYQNMSNSYNSPQIQNVSVDTIFDSPYNRNDNEQDSFDQEESTPKMYFDFNQNHNNAENDQNPKELDKKYNGPQLSISNLKTNDYSLINKPEIEILPKIQNIVSTANFCCKLNLKEISLIAKNSEYNPKRFSGLIMRIKEPKTTALIFSTGKIVVLGAKTEQDSEKACRRFGKILKNNIGYKVFFKSFKIQNIVASCDIKFKIPLTKLFIHMKRYLNSKKIFYEAECFPGLIYHYIDEDSISNQADNKQLNLVFLIFWSGKIVIAGAKNRNQIYKAFEKVYPLLKQFKENL